METNNLEIKRYEDHLILRNFSKSTIRSYKSTLVKYFTHCNKLNITQNLDQELIRNYLVYLYKKGLSYVTVNTNYSAIKLYFENILMQEWNCKKIPRPKKEFKLPEILSPQEVVKIIDHARMYKHQILFTFLYVTGMRISEALAVRLYDIDSKRLQIKVQCGKGKKDRYVEVPMKLIEILRSYYKFYKPVGYLFNGAKKGEAYDIRSAQVAMQKSVRAAKITKHISVHSLRHCFATHHLEAGTDLVYLKEQMGHTNLKTTSGYIHLCTNRHRNVHHPIEELQIQFH